MELKLDTPVRFVPGVGPKIAQLLDKLNIHTTQDFLLHLPHRYNDFSVISPISRTQPGETVTIRATVESIKAFATKRGKRLQEAVVSDESGSMRIIWFNQQYLLRVIQEGDVYFFSGEVNWFGNKLVLTAPQFEAAVPTAGKSLHTGRLVPVYPETEGISSKRLRSRIAFLLDAVGDSVTDHLPEEICRNHSLMSLPDALRHIHFPEDTADAAASRRRLAFDELFQLVLTAYLQKRQRQETQHAHRITTDPADVSSLIESLPFSLTDDQLRAIRDIAEDMSRDYPMNRLIAGDVGSGKTVVAAIAMYAALRNGHQCVLMAPTQILAVQHHETIRKLLGPLGITVDLITGNTKTRSKDAGQAPLFSDTDTPSVVVGTHALLSYQFALDDVGLVVIDEQQRFGVDQRNTLASPQKGTKTPHLLTMTATPIPRTLAKTLLGSVDVSTIDQMPKGRKKIKTWVVPQHKREAALAWIKKELTEHKTQAYIIYPLVEQSESESMSDVRAVTGEFETLKKTLNPLSVKLLHGRLKPKEKTDTLASFAGHETDVLVATPVVEVGIDVPNATVMMIEEADRFGLGQLHQLRGRVGRSSLPSYCLLFTQTESEDTLTRLKSLETTFSGPKLAEIDLRLRGPGEVFGTKQHGLPYLRAATFTDYGLIEEVKTAVETIVNTSPDLKKYPDLSRWAKKSTIEASGID